MEETDHNIRVFLFLQLLHPVLGRSHHVLKAETAPEVFCQPVRDGRSNHAQDGNLHTLTVEDDIRFHVRSLGLGVDDVGTDHRTVEFLNPVVIIAGRLSLQDISVFQQDEIILVGLAERIHVWRNTSERTSLRLAVDEIVREEGTVYVTGFYYS